MTSSSWNFHGSKSVLQSNLQCFGNLGNTPGVDTSNDEIEVIACDSIYCDKSNCNSKTIAKIRSILITTVETQDSFSTRLQTAFAKRLQLPSSNTRGFSIVSTTATILKSEVIGHLSKVFPSYFFPGDISSVYN
ncbi:unnamed protein product [Clavelina lepadiformis]|uniref:Uncharacterized protein n=1 Tax=Clavelina lepadiformis TaxID=159417 RepID=A0ABP0FCU6_CLALP